MIGGLIFKCSFLSAALYQYLIVQPGTFVINYQLKLFNMSELVKEFNDYRTKMNEVILSKDNLVIKRLWNLDTNTY
jgi:hypothetical protein